MSDHVTELLAAWRVELPEALTPYSELVKRVLDLSALLQHEIAAAAAVHDLTMAEYDVLVALRRNGKPYELTPTALRRDLLLSSGGTSNVLRRLAERGLIARTGRSKDRRSLPVRLTAAGVRLSERALLASTQAQGQLMRDTTRADIRTAAAALARVQTALAANAPGRR